jgi:8-oxo-dGTP pyrophosphatase MutT (NUDIX family)
MAFPTHIVAAAGFVEDAKGDVLLVRTHHRGWDVPGGQIENGESVEDGLLREILEESGVKARVCQLVGVYSNVGQHLYHDGITHVPTKVMLDFICEHVSGVLQASNETSDVKWVPKNKATEMITSPAQKFRFQKYLEFQDRVSYCSYLSKPDFKVMSDRYI